MNAPNISYFIVKPPPPRRNSPYMYMYVPSLIYILGVELGWVGYVKSNLDHMQVKQFP